MTRRLTGAAALAAAVVLHGAPASLVGQEGPLVLGFHHVHMNVVDPGRSATFYETNFQSKRVTVAGWAGVQTEDIFILFSKVSQEAPHAWDTPIWHFGWSSRSPADDYKRISTNGVKFSRVPPPTAHMIGPDQNDIEIAVTRGDWGLPPPAFNHVHLQADAPFCTSDWYENVLGLQHPPDAGRIAGADCHVPYPARSNLANQYLNPNGTIRVGSIELFIYPHQRLEALTSNVIDTQGPLVSPRGHVVDHIAMTVADVPAAVRRLRGRAVRILEDTHPFGSSKLKAAMIEGPDKMAIELVEAAKPQR